MISVIKQFEHLKIQLEAIKLATNNFAQDHCIGKGGFGEVYKGELAHSKGHTVVALKRLNRVFGQGDPEFWKEIVMLSLYKHDNIVSLLGFCDENGEKILVYEYASKRSLDLYLASGDLTWIQRLKICIGAARGLAYLHSSIGTQQRVLHRDIKSSNILLDDNWNARISDMGLSKFGPANQQITFLVSNAVGTLGYCDPQYIETGLLTKESDVYSFGVVLFEVLCGRLCISNNKDKSPPLTRLARQSYEHDTINDIICYNIKDVIIPSSLKAFTDIAYRCLKINPDERPIMTKVVGELGIALDCQITGTTFFNTDFGSAGNIVRDLRVQDTHCELEILGQRKIVSRFVDHEGRIQALLVDKLKRVASTEGISRFDVNVSNSPTYSSELTQSGSESGNVEPLHTRHGVWKAIKGLPRLTLRKLTKIWHN